jgi:hypothetical protein
MTSAIDRVRHGRQIRLAEIGEAGQARLASRAVAPSGAGLAREIEETYLARAGVRVRAGAARGGAGEGSDATDDPGQAPAAAPARVDPSILGLRHGGAREVGEGALRALAAIRALLEVAGP